MENDVSTAFSFDDALILYCIRKSKRGETVTDILGWEDMVNRSASTCEELDMTLRRAIAFGLITRQQNRFQPTRLLAEWQTEDHDDQTSHIERIERFQVELNTRSAELARHAATIPDQILDEATYHRAYRRYIVGFGATLIIPFLILVLSIIAAVRYSWLFMLIPVAVVGGIIVWGWMTSKNGDRQ